MTYTLTYTGRYAHLGSVAFPTYPDRATAEAERARIVASQTPARGDIEIVETPHEIRGNAGAGWDNGDATRAGSAPTEADPLATISTRPKGA